ncbi:MAG TPA: Rieske (2Fe-2S) protein [Gemmatimonadales bacterium]|nr:Rieske (2Fe-2S) protein [Gemmatimonadales bacterium]
MARDAPAAGFNDLLLGGVLLVMLTALGLGTALYLLPAERGGPSGLEPGVRVAALAQFPVGSARVVSLGERIVLVVRAGQAQFAALHGTSPVDGCILEWDAPASRVVSPCRYLVYDLHGNVVAGLTTRPLRRYAVRVLGDAVYVVNEDAS